jgi:lipopolysaccharide transport system permease protein
VWFLPGLALLMLNLAWMAQIVAISSARYRDVPQLVAAIVQILFYITPLMWRPGMLSKHAWLITFNPFAALVDLVRSPLLGDAPAAASWTVGLCLAVVGWLLALWMYSRTADRVAYWV